MTEYLQRVPDPIKLYSDANRVTLSDGCEEDTNYVLNFLYNQFRFIRTKQIDRVFKHFKQNLKETCNKLKVLPKAFRTCRPIIEPPECTNIKLLQEVSRDVINRALDFYLIVFCRFLFSNMKLQLSNTLKEKMKNTVWP